MFTYHQFSITEYVIKNNKYESYPDIPGSVYDTLKLSAKNFPEKTALLESDKKITFKELDQRVCQLANNLRNNYDIKKGDICSIMAVNSIDFCISFYAVLKLGAIAMPISTKLKAEEILFPLKNSKSRIIITDEAWFSQINEIITDTFIEKVLITDNKIYFGKSKKQVNSVKTKKISDLGNSTCTNEDADISLADGAVLIYTSGTTGMPKGALINHFNILHSVLSYEKILNVTSSDTTLISTPIFHVTGLIAVMCLFIKLGATAYLHFNFNARKTINCIKENEISFFHASPTIYQLIIEELAEKEMLNSLMKCVCGSANLPINIIRQLKMHNKELKMFPVYGLTETSSPAAIMPFDPLGSNKEGSSGIAIPGMQIRIVDQLHGKELPRNNVGLLEVKGSSVISGYLSATKEDKKAFKDGWFNTGDIGLMDEENFIFILDRVKDMINRGGEKIYSIEVENAINSHPKVLECSVIAFEDKVFGEVPHAIIRIKDDFLLTEKDLNEYLLPKIAKYKIPASYDFVSQIPKTENGKINKKKIREILQEKQNGI